VSKAWRWYWSLSLVVHSGLIATGLATSHPRARAGQAASLGPVEFDIVAAPAPPGAPPTPGLTRVALAATPVQPEPLGGAQSTQNLDADERGERGDGRSLERGRLLAARAEAVNLSAVGMNTLREVQEHRLHTARDRASPQDRRSTPNPGYDPWIASAGGILLYRLPRADQVPAPGALVPAGPAVALGAAPPPSRPLLEGPDAIVTAPSPLGGARRPASGIVAGIEGHASRVAGPSADGHASIERGHASTTADQAEPRPRDDVDAETLASNYLQNSISASVHAGPVAAPGAGGVGGGGAAGSGGGHDEGGRARPFGEGHGWLSLAAPDSRYMMYFQEVSRRLYPLWANAFPREAALRLEQGTVILHFVIESDGRVTDVQVARHSGVNDFDHNVRNAVASARLPPIPAELGASSLRVSAPFIFRNPIVR
jgi:TonB family protein